MQNSEGGKLEVTKVYSYFLREKVVVQFDSFGLKSLIASESEFLEECEVG